MARGKGKGGDETTADEARPRVVAGDDGTVRMYDPHNGGITSIAVEDRVYERDSNGCFVVAAGDVVELKRQGLVVRD